MAGAFSTFVGPGARGMDAWGKSHVMGFRYTGPSSYATGGEALTPGQIKLGTIEAIIPAGPAIAATGAATAIIFAWNPETAKMQAFWGNAGTAGTLPEVTSTTDLTQYRGNFLGFGKG